MTENFILSKIEAITTKYVGTNTLIAVKGLPINLIPETVKSQLIDIDVLVGGRIDDEHFFSKKFRRDMRNKLEEGSDNCFFALYESLLLAKPYDNEFFDSKIVIVDFSFSSYVPNSFTNFNYNISDLNESAEDFEIGDFNAIIANSVKIGDNYFVQYTDSELLNNADEINIAVEEKKWNYQSLNTINETEISKDQFVFNPEDISYVDWVYSLMNNTPSSVDLLIDNETVKSAFGKEMLGKILFLAYAFGIKINLLRIKHDLQRIQRPELFNLLKRYWNSESFRSLKIYADPDISKDLIEISQADVVENIIQQYEFGNIHNTNFQDVFLTAPTGAGKSLLFQMPAIYIGEKYGALSIVVSPLKALMVDQVEQLRNEKGYSKVAYINSDISVIRREEIINQIKDNEIDMLYMAPELLLSYDISFFLNSRKLGLYIVDEAHTVSTWGRDFRIDYWYLGFHINRVRKYAEDEDGKKLKFPVVAVTATAPYGSKHDVAFQTMQGLQMKSPIKYIGYAKRDNISFEINHKEYDGNLQTAKVKQTVSRIKEYNKKKDKTIVYCPFTTQVNDIQSKAKELNLNSYSFHGGMDVKDQTESYSNFKNGSAITMVATKAFGMGVDISDINRVYHFAPTGLLTDYIQEIGRAARDKNTQGFASLDYSERDFQFINQLHGLSRLHNWQLQEIIRRLVKIYDETNQQNHLLNIDDFANIFNKNSAEELTQEVKKALLLIEKDLNSRFKNIPVIIARPKNMFSTVFASIDNDRIDEFVEKFGIDNIEIINYYGINHLDKSIIKIKLDNIWEDHFREDSFGVVKRNYFQETLFEGFDIKPKLQIKLSISSSYGTTIQKLDRYLNIVERAIVSQQGFFTSNAFKIELVSLGMEPEMAKRVGDILLSMFSQSANGGLNYLNAADVREFSNFLQLRRKKGQIEPEYRLVTNALGQIVRNIKRTLKLRFENKHSRTVTLYNCMNSGTKHLNIKIGQVLELFDLGGYEATGGENPRMFVRINDPFRLRIESKKKYENSYLQDIIERHRLGVGLMKEFFESELTSDQRWNFIEDYLLGNKDNTN